MQKSQYEQQRIEKLQNMYKACKEALKIIGKGSKLFLKKLNKF